MNVPVISEQFKKVELVEPTVLRVLNDDGTAKLYSLQKEAIRYIYWNLGMSLSSSKILFKADKDSWKRYITQQATREELPEPFSLNNKWFVILGGFMVVAITDTNIIDKLTAFFDKLDSEHVKYVDNEFLKATINLGYERIYDKLMVEMDFINGIYRIGTSVDTNGVNSVFASPCVIMNSIEDFLKYDYQYEYSLTVAIINDSSISIGPDILKETKLSVRELLDIVRICGIKFKVDSNGFVDKYQDTEDKVVNKLAEIFRSIAIPYKSIRKMKYLEKSMRITSMSLYDAIGLLYENYLESEYSNVNAMNYLFYSVYYCGGDFNSLNK